MKRAPTIVLTGGGSGGHIMPLLSLAHALKRASSGCRIIYIGLNDETISANLKERFKAFDEVYRVPAGKFRRYHDESLLAHLVDLRLLYLNARDFFRFLRGIRNAKRILKHVQPDVVFSKGGFVAVPVGIAASRLKIPIVTHDSDTVPGLANRLVGHFATRRTNAASVGVPIDERIKPVTSSLQARFKKQLGLPSKSLILLIGGAGLGARDVNNKVLAVAGDLLGLFGNLYILHVTGTAHERAVAAAYNSSGIDNQRVKVIGFTDEFYQYTSAADLIITRAGATTIAELAAQKKAVVLIPAPHLTGGHQLKNAAWLAKNQAALVVPNEASAAELMSAVADVLGDTAKQRSLANSLAKLAKPDAADKLARIILKIAAKKMNNAGF